MKHSLCLGIIDEIKKKRSIPYTHRFHFPVINKPKQNTQFKAEIPVG